MPRRQAQTRFRIVQQDGAVFYTGLPISDPVVAKSRRELRVVADGMKDVGARLQESHDDGPWRDSPVEGT